MFPENQSEWPPAQPEATPQSPAPRTTHTRRGGKLAATVVGVALFGALIGVAADRWAVTNFNQSLPGASLPSVTIGPRVGPIAAPNGGSPAATTGTTSTDPTQQAIQQVIQ